ncbi:anti-sigma factor [Paenibacillus lautus]|uniref:anti-sigma factor n=1 Tax=Paenibacillus lautus TaxID=1401 RepID=UPI003D2B3100
MSEEFKQRLKDYADGHLSDEEKIEVEREMEKLEEYQAYLDEWMDNTSPNSAAPKRPDDQTSLSPKKEKRIVRRGKWRARVSNTLTVISLLLIVTVISSIVTALFYGTGNPSRNDKYRDAIASAISISQPNIDVRLNSQGKIFFMQEVYGDIDKKVGKERVTVGEYTVNFLFGLPSVDVDWKNGSSGSSQIFYRPNSPLETSSTNQDEDPKKQSKKQQKNAPSAKSGDWSRLEKLPEGTVAEAYVSFNRFFSTDELLKQFENRNMEAVWFAVDNGPDTRFGGEDEVISHPIGFPAYPVWHHDDLTVTSYKEEKRGWFGKVVSSGGHYPSVEAYGDGELRNEHFIKSLRLLQEYELIANRVAPFVDVDASLAYVEQNGVHLYGAVITGPVKELLTLREVSWVRDLRVGEVRLWNWTD